MISLIDLLFTYSIVTHINEAQFAENPKYRIKVGMIIPKSDALRPLVGYQRSASAVLIAMDRIRDEQLLPEVNFTFVIKFEECDEHTAVGRAIELITVDKVDVIVGPPCDAPAESVGIVTAFYDVMTNLWGPTTNAELSDLPRFPTVATVNGNSLALGLAVLAIMNEYNWTELAFIYTASHRCIYMDSDLERAVRLEGNQISITYKRQMDINEPNLSRVLKQIHDKARIVLTCFDNRKHFRDLLLTAKDMEVINDEYVYIFTDTAEYGFGPAPKPIWQSTSNPPDGRDQEALEVLKYALFVEVDHSDRLPLTKEKFSSEVLRRMSEWPFYCSEEECPHEPEITASAYAGHLYDTMYLYAIALNKTLQENENVNATHSGAAILMNAVGEFDGMSGRVIIGGNGTRDPVYIVRGLNKSLELDVFLKIRMYTIVPELRRLYMDEATSIWALRNGTRPITPPRCGYDGTECSPGFLEEYYGYVICAALIAFLVMLFTIFGIAFTIRSKIKEAEKANLMWQIPFAMLITSGTKNLNGIETSVLSELNAKVDCGSRRVPYMLNGEQVIGVKHPVNYQLFDSDFTELRFMRHFIHGNINEFFGLSLDAPILMSVWKYCSRRSLNDVIRDNCVTMDAFFVYSLIHDIASGISAIHNSMLHCHGRLTSKQCLIDERWQLKLSDYGLKTIRRNEPPSGIDLLWMAPEILRSAIYDGTQEGDIYSFAIICSELIMRQSAWNIEGRKESTEEIVYMIKRGGIQPMRPELNLQRYRGLNPSMMHLVKECWSENPNQRPKIKTIRSLLKSMNDNRNTNLMDHVFALLEKYASTLETEVEERTKELIEEKKKSDILLYRLLPKQVAERLKLGQPVEPESYDCVTVFFSDVVSFTKLAGRCTPLQVVNLLNDLYTAFDGIIDTHDVYKVETIGDGYLCVSGLPKRNGNEHAREIANMSLAFMECLKHYRVPHMPDERINLRIGIHCGPCVAGVVGLTMPRYCLFGDTVNTASRMESNGKPGMIHISADANRFLTVILGGFHTETRGEVIIKGKGVMETFWLLGKGNQLPTTGNMGSMDGSYIDGVE